MLINESYDISSFQSLNKFSDKLPFLWHLLDLKLPKMGRNLKQSLKVPIFTHGLYVFTRKDLCFGTCCKVVLKCSVFWHTLASRLWDIYKAFRRPCRKNAISGSIWHKSLIQMVNLLFPWQKNCLSKFLRCAAHILLIYNFLQGKVVCFGMRFQVACLDRVYLCRKNVTFPLYLFH